METLNFSHLNTAEFNADFFPTLFKEIKPCIYQREAERIQLQLDVLEEMKQSGEISNRDFQSKRAPLLEKKEVLDHLYLQRVAF